MSGLFLFDGRLSLDKELPDQKGSITAQVRQKCAKLTMAGVLRLRRQLRKAFHVAADFISEQATGLVMNKIVNREQNCRVV
jgi:hypothetical protein